MRRICRQDLSITMQMKYGFSHAYHCVGPLEQVYTRDVICTALNTSEPVQHAKTLVLVSCRSFIPPHHGLLDFLRKNAAP